MPAVLNVIEKLRMLKYCVRTYDCFCRDRRPRREPPKARKLTFGEPLRLSSNRNDIYSEVLRL